MTQEVTICSPCFRVPGTQPNTQVLRLFEHRIKEQGRPWEEILAHYESFMQHNPSGWAPYWNLVQAISLAPYASLLHGDYGMFGLFLYGYAPFAQWHDMLWFTWDSWEKGHVFRYQETAWTKPCWHKYWTPDDPQTIQQVFEHIITNRLKWIPRSMLTA